MDFSLASSVFKIVSGVMNFTYRIKRYKKQIIDEEEFSYQFEKSVSKVFNHLYKLNNSFDQRIIDTIKLINHVKRLIQRDNEFLLFYRGEIEEKIFNLILPDKPLRINSFIKYSFFMLNGYDLLSKKYYYSEYLLSYWPWHKTVMHYISIPGWPNLSEKELSSKVIDIKKPTPRIYEKFLVPDYELIDKHNPKIGEAIEKVISSGTVTTETALNLMASEKLLLVHKYAEDFNDIYKAQKEINDNLVSTIKKLKLELRKENIDDKEKEEIQSQINQYDKELSLLKDNWATVPIGNKLEEYGFQRLFNNMDGVYGIPLSLIPKKERKNFEKFFKHNIEKPADKYLKFLKKNNEFVKSHDGRLKYIVIFHIVTIDQFIIFKKERDLSISPLLSKTMFKLYLSNTDNKIANLYLNELIRNVDFSFYLNTENKTDSFIFQKIDKLKMILFNEYNIDIATPSLMTRLTKIDFENIAKELIKKSRNAPASWRIRDKLYEIRNNYEELESEFKKLKR